MMWVPLLVLAFLCVMAVCGAMSDRPDDDVENMEEDDE